VENLRIPAIYCKQWLTDWDDYQFQAENERRKPPEKLLLFSMSAKQLRKLSGVYVRKRDGVDASGIQRMHEKDRSQRIAEYVQTGYPYGDLSAKQKSDPNTDALKKPGWLPTAIVVNFLRSTDERREKRVAERDEIKVIESNGGLQIALPEGSSAPGWEPEMLAPIEVIDGQHRLFAFDESSRLPDDFELPVVAFQGLDIGWQAYLFWSINVSPKKINPSHAYDLFPLLRTQDWLETVSAVHVYREARAQELTDLLYKFPGSPWKGRINMLGERKTGWVSQAGWVQAIYNSFLSVGQSARGRKGLFAANLSTTSGPLDWSRPQQAAFLIFVWQQIQAAVAQKKDGWAQDIRDQAAQSNQPMDFEDGHDLAFVGGKTLLNQEQGVRGFCLVCNDILFRVASSIGLDKWQVSDIDAGETRNDDIDRCLTDLKNQPCAKPISEALFAFADFDWRSSDVNGLEPQVALRKAAYRGTGGYSRVRQDLLDFLSEQPVDFAAVAKNIIDTEGA